MELLKTRLIRKQYGINSLFYIKANYVTEVIDTDGNKLKYEYNPESNKLIILDDCESIYVFYK